MRQNLISPLCVPLGGVALQALWRYRRPFSIDHFINALHMKQGSARRYPVLNSFIAQVRQVSESLTSRRLSRGDPRALESQPVHT